MQFNSVGGAKKYFKYSECEEGDVLVTGKYIGRSPNKFGNDNWDFKPEDGGPTVCLNSAGQLNYLMENYVREGDVVQITYKGTHTLDKGAFKGKPSHQFDVAVAESSAGNMTVGNVNKVEAVESAPNTGTVDLSDLD